MTSLTYHKLQLLISLQMILMIIMSHVLYVRQVHDLSFPVVRIVNPSLHAHVCRLCCFLGVFW